MLPTVSSEKFRLRMHSSFFARLGLACTLIISASFAFAVQRNDSGKGQVLLFPFFTTENGWDTYINLVLLSVNVNEAFKIRVLDGVDGQVVNTFNVYAKVGENWRAALTQLDQGQSVLRVSEGLCTIAEDGQFGGDGTDFPIDTNTGLLEIYRMGIRDGPGSGVLKDSTCETLAARWEVGGVWSQEPLAGLSIDESQPELVGHFDLINVALGLSAEQSAIGLRDFMSAVPHTAPDDVDPSLLDADPVARMSSGEEVFPESGEGIDAVALLLSTVEGTMTGDVTLREKVAASTDWIVSFPLRGYRHYGSYELEIDGVMRTCNENELTEHPTLAIAKPLYNPWSTWGEGPSYRARTFLDPTPPARYSPFLCYTVNLLTFGGDNDPIFSPAESVLQERVGIEQGSLIFRGESFSVSYEFTDGRVLDPAANQGRPVVAYRASIFVNGTLDGGSVLANYMFLRPLVIQ